MKKIECGQPQPECKTSCETSCGRKRLCGIACDSTATQ